MSFLPKKVVGIDLHDHSGHLVELKLMNKNISMEAYNRVLIPANIIRDGEIKKEDEFKKAILEFLKNANPKPIDSKNVAIIFPSRKTFTHIFKFPINLREEEIKKAIPYEAETIIPFGIQDVYWDFTILYKDSEKDKHASQYVLFAAVPKSIADQYAKILESMDLSPYLFGIHVEALQHALLHQVDSEKTTLVIELGTLSTNYMILKNQKIHYFFSSNEGGGQVVSALAKEFNVEESAIIKKWEENKLETKYFLPTIKKFILEDYKIGQTIVLEQEANKRIGRIQEVILTGEFLNLPQVYDLAKTAFPNQTVSVGDPKKGLQIEDEKFLPAHKEEGSRIPYSTYFTSAIGIALRVLRGKGGNGGINLLPDRLKENFLNRRNTLLFGAIAVTMCAISLFAGTHFFFKHQSLTFDRLNLEIRKSAIEKMIYGTRYGEIRESITTFNTEVNILSTIDNSLFSTPALLDNVYETFPSGITIGSIRFSDSELNIEISGIADTREDLLQLQQNLENTAFIDEVIAPISNYDQRSQISFVLKLNLNFIELPPYATQDSA